MWVRNTSSYPTEEVRELVELATETMDMRHVCVNVKGGRRWCGYAYDHVPDISNAPRTAKYLVTIRLPRSFESQDVRQRNRRWPASYRMHDWREALVVIAAHEAKHIEQYREGLPRKETSAEHFARWALSRYRVRRMKAQACA